jgi:peptide deformylase
VLVAAMLETMREADGVGLAAPQVGAGVRVAVIDRRATENNEDLILINPMMEVAWGEATMEEGCLSLPGVWTEVRRATHVRARYADLSGNEKTVKADGMLAIAIQHELDHLDGVLLVDRISPHARQALAGALDRIKESTGAAA